jgi:predicted PurR-regulated permease PerM
MSFNPVTVSYLLSVLTVPLVLHFHLLPSVFAGLAVHVLTIKLARRFPVAWGGLTRKVALGALATIVMIGLTGIVFGLWAVLHGKGGMGALLVTLAEILEKLRQSFPDLLAGEIPATVEDLHDQINDMLREHGKNLSMVGMAGFKTLAHVLLGMIVGGMTALHHFTDVEMCPPFTAALHARSGALSDAFDKVVFAQVKIAAINTLLTALYLLVFLPLWGIHLPLLTVLILLTFVTGLLPVVGNLISNVVIVLISLGVSPGVALASLCFLIVIHKLEYFTNARIVGGEVHASAWELLSAMLVMEAMFGLGGLIAAPVVYAWLKSEVQARNVI